MRLPCFRSIWLFGQCQSALAGVADIQGRLKATPGGFLVSGLAYVCFYIVKQWQEA